MRVGIVGFGPMGKRHAAAVACAPGLELVAVADRRPEAFESKELEGSVLQYSDALSLIEEARPELVVVATNAPSHSAVVMAAVEHGARAVLCEKPIACSLAEADLMIRACDLAGARLAVNHCLRHVPAYGWVRERIASGLWGTLRGVRMASPGIGLGCVTTHYIDLASFLSGDAFVRVTGWVDPERGPNPRGAEFHDPGGLVVAEGASGARFVFQQMEDASGPASIVLDLTLARVVIEEREERVSVILRDPSVKPGPGRPPKFDEISLPNDRPLKIDVVELTAAVMTELAGGDVLTCSGGDGYRSLETVVAAYVSNARGNVPVGLPLDGDEALTWELAIT